MPEPDVEQWENVSKGKIGVNKFGPDGTHRTVQELVGSGGKVLVSPKEREILNQQRCYSDDLDPFQNGFLRLVSGAEDTEIASSPNHMSEDDMRSLFGLRNWMQFRSAVKEISSTFVLERMLELASDEEDLDATVKQVEVLQAQLTEAGGGVGVQEVSHAGTVGGNTSMVEDDDRRTVLPMRRD